MASLYNHTEISGAATAENVSCFIQGLLLYIESQNYNLYFLLHQSVVLCEKCRRSRIGITLADFFQ